MSADLALLVNDPDAIERAADPAVFVIQACERAKAWLREVLDHGDIETIVEIKSQAEAVRVYTMQKQLGKDAELSAAEVVRRAERGIGVAIRKGQEDGTIRRPGDRGPIRSGFERVRNGRVEHVSPQGDAVDNGNSLKPGPTDFVSSDELSANGSGIYQLADGVADQEFEAALSDAKGDKNLSRANVVRKIKQHRTGPDWTPAPDDRTWDAVQRRRALIRKLAGEGYSSRQIAGQVHLALETVREYAREDGIDIPADKIIRGTRHIDSNRIVRETVHALEGIAMGVEMVDPAELDQVEIADWTTSLTQSVRVLNRLIKTMRETVQ